MSKIGLIIQREYLTRVRKKSFIIMTFLGPLLFGGALVLIGYLAVTDKSERTIAVVDESGLFTNKLDSIRDASYVYLGKNLEQGKKELAAKGYDVLMYLPENTITDGKGVKLYYEKSPGGVLESVLQKRVETEVENQKLDNAGIDRKKLESFKTEVSFDTVQVSEEGEKDDSIGAATVVAFVMAFLTYIFIFVYGVQVMRGVMEEKTSRIVEVIISSVKPFQLMMGKVLGIALVGLTQFLLWGVLTLAVTTVAGSIVADNAASTPGVEQATQIHAPAKHKVEKKAEKNKVAQFLDAMKTQNYALIVGCFLIYFLGGYLIYASLFAAVGSAVDSDADVQQFMLPITIPIIVSFSVAQIVIQKPDSDIAFWMSMVPFTSPIIMMVRVPFGVPVWQLLLSISILVATFTGVIWLAGRIYRVGILLYGKKVTYKELGKWLFYKG